MTDTEIELEKNSVVALNSKRLRKAAYDAETKKLTVWSGRFNKIVHRDISPGVYNNLVTAPEPDFYYFHYIHREPSKRRVSVWRWILLLLLLVLVTVLWTPLMDAAGFGIS